MGRGSTAVIVALAGALVAFPSAALAVGGAIPDPTQLLGDASASSSVPSTVQHLPGAAPSTPTAAAPARGILDALLGAAGALGGSIAGLAGGLGRAGAALVDGLAALLAALAGAVVGLAAGLAGLAVALVSGLASLLLRGAERAAANPTPLASVAAGAGVGWLASLAHARGFAPVAALYSRLQDHELLGNDARRRIYDFVRDAPGAHVSQVCQAMGLGWGTTVYHLNRMRDGQLLSARRVGNQLCHFVNGGALAPEEQRLVLATKTPKAQAIVDFLALRGPSNQVTIADELGMSSALVSWHAKRLEEMGVVERARRGRTCTLTLKAPEAASRASRAVVRPLPPAAAATPVVSA